MRRGNYPIPTVKLHISPSPAPYRKGLRTHLTRGAPGAHSFPAEDSVRQFKFSAARSPPRLALARRYDHGSAVRAMGTGEGEIAERKGQASPPAKDFCDPEDI